MVAKQGGGFMARDTIDVPPPEIMNELESDKHNLKRGSSNFEKQKNESKKNKTLGNGCRLAL